MKILHVIQNLEKEKGGGVTERNIKLIEYIKSKERKITAYLTIDGPQNRSYSMDLQDLAHLPLYFPL